MISKDSVSYKSFLNRAIDGTVTSTTTPGQNGFGSNGNHNLTKG